MNTKNKLFAPYAFKVYNMDWKVQIQTKKIVCVFQYANNANRCIFIVAVLKFPSIQFTKEKEKYISIILVQLLCVSSTKKCNNLSCI